MIRSFLARTNLISTFAILMARDMHGQTPPPLLTRPPESQSVVVTGDQAWKIAISHPAPDYPIEARRRHLVGSGVYQAKVDEYGDVDSVTIITSTGYPILDNAAVKALKKWRFRAHTGLTRIKVPIKFSIPKSKSAKERT